MNPWAPSPRCQQSGEVAFCHDTLCNIPKVGRLVPVRRTEGPIGLVAVANRRSPGPSTSRRLIPQPATSTTPKQFPAFNRVSETPRKRSLCENRDVGNSPVAIRMI